MIKKNLPNIPIYIGDWERDCNVLCLESEAAWLRIVFKLWTKGKQNSIKIPTKSLQNLWRCSPEKMRVILDDLIYNEIADIVEKTGFVEFTCRRFVKENKISEIRSNASKGIQKGKKLKSNDEQSLNKNEQNTDNEIDYENAYNFLTKNKSEKILIFEMQNKKTFNNYNQFIDNFNNKVTLEKLEFEPKILMARLRLLNSNWDKEKQLKKESDVSNR